MSARSDDVDDVDGGDGGDAIDEMLAAWRRERPDLDLAPLGILGRLAQATAVAGRVVDDVFVRHGLRSGEFDVLTALRRAGEPFTLTPSTLADALMLSRTGMTNRLDRLETAGLVERRLDPADRRSFRVVLTDAGRAVVDATLTDHAATMARIVDGLDARERAALADLLRRLLRSATKTLT